MTQTVYLEDLQQPPVELRPYHLESLLCLSRRLHNPVSMNHLDAAAASRPSAGGTQPRRRFLFLKSDVSQRLSGDISSAPPHRVPVISSRAKAVTQPQHPDTGHNKSLCHAGRRT